MTNIERWRSMTPQEIAAVVDRNFIGGLLDQICMKSVKPVGDDVICPNHEDCRQCIAAWLTQPMDPDAWSAALEEKK